MNNDRQVSSDEARTKFRDLMDEVARTGDRVHIMRYGKPTAVIVPVDWYDAVIGYVHATTLTSEAAAFYARERAKGSGWFARPADKLAATQTEEHQQ